MRGFQSIFVALILGVSIAARADTGTPWWKDAVVYQIFVRSFQDSNADGIGDLSGITSRLDYIRSLGADAIWLTPIFKSNSYHGYDATDYFAIDPQYGSLEDFKKLITSAHERGIRVLLDIAVNHTSIENEWFKAHPSWYCWSQLQPSESQAPKWTRRGDSLYYSEFKSDMPDLNWKNPEVREVVKNVLRHWRRLGVDGFRLDAAQFYGKLEDGRPNLKETVSYVSEFTEQMRREYPGTYFIGEVWGNNGAIAPFINPTDALDAAFDFPLSDGLVQSLESHSAGPFYRALNESKYFFAHPTNAAPFLRNHDQNRLATILGKDTERLKLAATVLMTLPGTPYIYYGEEVGLQNGDLKPEDRWDDRPKRTPMPWSEGSQHDFTSAQMPWYPFPNDVTPSVNEQSRDWYSLLEHYRHSIQLRKDNPALRSNDLTPLETYDPNIMAYLRSAPEQNLLVVINFGTEERADLSFRIPAKAGQIGRLTSIWGEAGGEITLENNGINLKIHGIRPKSVSILTAEWPR